MNFIFLGGKRDNHIINHSIFTQLDFLVGLTDLPKAVELFPLPMEVLPSITQITLRWNRVEDAQNYRVYQQIENQDSEWIRVRTTTDDRCTTKVEKGNVYRFKVTGGNVHGEGKERNIRIVKVLGESVPY